MSLGRDPLGGLGETHPAQHPAARPGSAGPRPRRLGARSSPTAWVLVLVLGGFFIAQCALGNWDPEDPVALFRLGALNWSAVFGGDWFRLGSYSFLHVGVAHFLLNAWALWILMRLVEGAYGSVTALGLYALAVLVGGVASVFWSLSSHNPYTVAAGASGGIAGLFGAFIALWIRVRKRIPREASRATLQMLLVNLGLNVLIAWQAGANGLLLDNAAHLGGLSAGLLFGLLAPLAVLPRRFWSRPAQALLVLATFVLAGMEGAAVARAVHPHSRLLRGDGVSAEVPWTLVPLTQLVRLSDDDGSIFDLPTAAPVGIAVGPGGIGLSAIISRSPQPLVLAPGSEAVPIGDRTWLRVRSKGPKDGEELQALSAKDGTGSLLVRVLCAGELCHGALEDDAAIEIARTFKVD